MRNIPNQSDATLLQTVRWWLVKKLVGKSLVVINAHIRFAVRKEFEPLQVGAEAGAYFDNVGFPIDGRTILRFEQK